MRRYQANPGEGIAGLQLSQCESCDLKPNEVRVQVHSRSLNYRDLMMVRGDYAAHSPLPFTPCSDGAGEVIEVGASVSRTKTGERVTASFFPDWIDGELSPEKLGGSLGGGAAGMLAEQIILPEHALVPIPENLSYKEASTLPCAAVTAWNVLFEDNDLKPGNTVLLLGTGGVSMWALQLAKRAGLSVIITSSRDEKLKLARDLGADVAINYLDQPQWHEEVLRQTAGKGVDLTMDIGGSDTLNQSVASTRMGGSIAVIGGVSGSSMNIDGMMLVGGKKRLQGILVGSRLTLEKLMNFVAANRISPVIDRTFAFEEAADAFRYLESGQHFGKVLIAG